MLDKSSLRIVVLVRKLDRRRIAVVRLTKHSRRQLRRNCGSETECGLCSIALDVIATIIFMLNGFQNEMAVLCRDQGLFLVPYIDVDFALRSVPCAHSEFVIVLSSSWTLSRGVKPSLKSRQT